MRSPQVGSAMLIAALVAAACSESDTPAPGAALGAASGTRAAPEPQASEPVAPADLVTEGRQLYLTNCIACHNPDPKQDGILGPAVAGAPEPLLEARILHGAYPEGYTPKRDTRNMVPMPFLKPKIPAIAAYLATER